MSNWNKQKLGHVADIKLSNVDKLTKLNERTVYLCNYTDVYKNSYIDFEKSRHFMIATCNDNEYNKFLLKKGQVAITKDSETPDDIGVSTYIADDFDDVVLGYHLSLITPDEEKLDGRFLHYWLCTTQSKRYFENNAGGSGQRCTLIIDTIETIPLMLPNLKMQQAISKILSDIDTKIELNNKINRELEAMAKTLYDYWFVQFDFPNEQGKPYKSSGGKMVYNVDLKREIPDGWEVKKMKDLLKKNNRKFRIDDDIQVIDTIDLSVMPRSTMCLNSHSKSTEFKTNLYRMSKFDILFGGIRPYLLKAGFAPFDGLVTGTVHSFEVKNKNDYNYALLCMIENKMFNYAISNSKGTKMPIISPDDLLDYKIPYNEIIIKKFNKIISFKETISKNILENKELFKLRDWLLPMLMNGQVKIQIDDNEIQ